MLNKTKAIALAAALIAAPMMGAMAAGGGAGGAGAGGAGAGGSSASGSGIGGAGGGGGTANGVTGTGSTGTGGTTGTGMASTDATGTSSGSVGGVGSNSHSGSSTNRYRRHQRVERLQHHARLEQQSVLGAVRCESRDVFRGDDDRHDRRLHGHRWRGRRRGWRRCQRPLIRSDGGPGIDVDPARFSISGEVAFL